jgi:hypothetical protein
VPGESLCKTRAAKYLLEKYHAGSGHLCLSCLVVDHRARFGKYWRRMRMTICGSPEMIV